MPQIVAKRKYHYISLAFALIVGFFVFGGSAWAQTVLQGYASDDTLQRGMVVALKEDDETKVEPLTEESVERFKGVVAEKNDSPVTISSEDRDNFVATAGPYEVLVSDENGVINSGDYVGISSTPGITAKATQFHNFVVGVAQNSFEGGGDTLSSAQTGENGRTINIGRVLVDVSFGRNPNAADPNDNKIPEVLKRIGESIADKPVSNFRIYMATAIFLGTAIVAGSMLFSGVRSAVISIGRNPLSKALIYKGLIQVVLFGLIIFITGLFGVYLILKL